KTELKHKLIDVRKRGVAFSREEGFEGITAVACLVHGADRKTIAALSIDVPTFRIHRYGMDRLVELVQMGASLISFWLGYQEKPPLVSDIENIRSWWSKTRQLKPLTI
ncbi:MAG: hypothetical protein JSV54_06220, partial [Chloroflexota bacterium]